MHIYLEFDVLEFGRLHLSLSRSKLKVPRFQFPFVFELLEQELRNFKVVVVQFTKSIVLQSKEEEKEFLCIVAQSQQLLSLVNIINNALRQFRIPTFYDPPIFHVSIKSGKIGELSPIPITPHEAQADCINVRYENQVLKLRFTSLS